MQPASAKLTAIGVEQGVPQGQLAAERKAKDMGARCKAGLLKLLTRRFGVVAAILAHAGGDAVVGFVLGDLVWDFLPLLRRL